MCTCNCCTDIWKSDSLNPYKMFQPNAPNFRRSCTTAWKKHTPYNNLVNARSLSGQP